LDHQAPQRHAGAQLASAFYRGDSGVTIVSVTSTDVDGNATGDDWAQVIRVSQQQSAIAWMATDIHAGTRTITVVLNQLDTYMQFNAFEVAYVSTAEVASALDGPASSATGISGDTVSSGAITTTQDGSILFQFAFDCSQLFATSLVKGSEWTLLGAQCVDGVALQYQVQTTHGAITPTLTRTTGSASNYNTIAYAVKADPTKGTTACRTARSASSSITAREAKRRSLCNSPAWATAY